MENIQKQTPSIEQAANETEKIAALEATVAALEQAVKDRDIKIAELEKLAYTDELTGIPNRLKFRQEFERRKEYLEENPAEAHENPDAILMLDLDNFKIVNDAFEEGHLGGDRILKEAAKHLVDYLQEQFRKDDIVARYGGEEFTVLLKNVDINGIMERLKLGFTTELDGDKIPITFSGGLTILKPGEDLREALLRADAALYVAKEDKTRSDGSIDRGRDRVFEYTDEMEKVKMKIAPRDLPPDSDQA